MSASKINMTEELNNRILTVIDQIDKGFRRVMTMYTIAFYVGIGMIVVSVAATLYTKENMFALLFGGAGAVDVVAFFVFKPAEDLQKSRGHLAQLTSAFLTWFNDIYNWNASVAKVINTRDEQLNIVALQEISKTIIANTISIMEAIDKFVEGEGIKDAKTKVGK
jgi:hypothetical protein